MDNSLPQSDSSFSTTSPSLLLGLQAQEGKGWDRFVSLYGPGIYAKCRRRGLSDADAQEICQDLFVKVYRSIPQFRRDPPRYLFRKWLATIYRSVLADFGRVRQRQPLQPMETEALERAVADLMAETDDETTFSLHDQDLLHALHQLLATMESDYEPRNWRAFWLSVIEGVPSAEVVQQLGISMGNLRQIKLRILRRIRDEFKELLE
jgi:RNA polymerase sigma-70 factor (ECF subfamily)